MRLSDPYNVSEFRARSTSVVILFSASLFILIFRLWYLQIWRGEEYRQFSDRNRFKVEKLSAPRGSLFDRNGDLLADSRPRFDVYFTRGNTQNVEQELNLLKDIFKWSEEDFEKKRERVLKSPRYQGQAVAQDASFDQLALIESQSLDLLGVDVEVNSVRDYLYKDLFFHGVGYTREISENDLKDFQQKFPNRNYKQGDQRGVIGIEALYEGLLRGKDGRDFVVVDVKGRRVSHEQWKLLPETSREEPEIGQSLRLSLDLNVQMAAYKGLEGRQGAAVALDPKTGEVLAYVSRPGLNPNLFTSVISNKDFDEWMQREDKPYLDRVVGEHYPPGSTLKLVMAAAALEAGVINAGTSFFCPGSFRLGNNVWRCHKKEGHGRVDVVDAIERSCDVFFYNAGRELGLDLMYAWSLRFGLGRRTFIGGELYPTRVDRLFTFNSEQPGWIPSADWILARKNTTVEAETINAAIGQGAFTVTALQLARMVSAIVNDGKIFQPQLVLFSLDGNGQPKTRFKSHWETEFALKPEVRELVMKGMDRVVHGAHGTAVLSKIPGIEFGGKTGTAQVVALDVQKKGGKRMEFQDHALFVGAAPLHDPKIAVAVIVENGGHGSSAAAPVAKAMISALLKPVAEVSKQNGN